MKRLPRPKCKLGFTTGQIGKIMGDRTDEFLDWMSDGLTMKGLCTGYEFDPDAGKDRMNGCGPHGNIFYLQDVKEFLSGGPVLD